jgi:hypothetical protein
MVELIAGTRYARHRPMGHKIQTHYDDPRVEPVPAFATEAEIALAARLRAQLEERYFGASEPALSSPESSAKVH